MSYDLFLKPKNGQFSEDMFRKYFSDREKYNLEESQAWYENEDTGVYFLFELQKEEDFEEGEEYFPVAFNMNYFRPSYFAYEAELELSDFINYFTMQVEDPQMHGMGSGSYDTGKFYKGWSYGNEFGYQSIIKDNPEVNTLPTEKLHYIWEWNFNKNKVQESIADDVFVPSIMLLIYRNNIVSAVVWPDAIPSLIPNVDILIIGRKDLAPRKLFKKEEDLAIGLWSEFSSLLNEHKEKIINGGYYLNYTSAPKSIKEKIKSLTASKDELERLSFDQVLDADIFEKFMPNK